MLAWCGLAVFHNPASRCPAIGALLRWQARTKLGTKISVQWAGLATAHACRPALPPCRWPRLRLNHTRAQANTPVDTCCAACCVVAVHVATFTCTRGGWSPRRHCWRGIAQLF